MKIGIIHPAALGDIVIALPIAAYYTDRGHQVVWSIREAYMPSFQAAFPMVQFLPVSAAQQGLMFAYHYPKALLDKEECNLIYCLYSHLEGMDLGHARLKESLTFDAYKYAVAKVPFYEKWNLRPLRDTLREATLFETLVLKPTDDYVVLHEQGSDHHVTIKLDGYTGRIIKIEPLTDNLFDWLGVLENAKELFLLDSVFANLVEQMNFPNKKTMCLRSSVAYTPVLKNDWAFL